MSDIQSACRDGSFAASSSSPGARERKFHFPGSAALRSLPHSLILQLLEDKRAAADLLRHGANDYTHIDRPPRAGVAEFLQKIPTASS